MAITGTGRRQEDAIIASPLPQVMPTRSRLPARLDVLGPAIDAFDARADILTPAKTEVSPHYYAGMGSGKEWNDCCVVVGGSFKFATGDEHSASPWTTPSAVLRGSGRFVNECLVLVQFGEDAAMAPWPMFGSSLALRHTARNELAQRTFLPAAVTVTAEASRSRVPDH